MMLGRHARYMPVLSEQHADGRDLVLRRRQGGRRQPGLREPHAQGLHPRLAGRRAATSCRRRIAELPRARRSLEHVRQHPRHLFRVTNFGESHGPAIGCVIDGCPPGMALSRGRHPARARPAPPRHLAPRHAAQRADAVEILSGVYEGKTTGTPICLLIRNTDQRSKDYGNMLDTFRPGHADYTYLPQVRPARPARRRPRVGAADGADGRRRRGRAQMAARAVRHHASPAT